MSSMPGTWCLPRFGLSFHSHTAKLDRSACAFFFLPDEPAGAAPSSPEESGNRILCFSSASGVLAFLLLSWALPAVFQWAVLQTLSPFLAAKHCTRWPQAPGSSGRCDTKSQLETEHFFLKSEDRELWQIQAPAWWSLCSNVQKCDKQNLQNGPMFKQKKNTLLFVWYSNISFPWHLLVTLRGYNDDQELDRTFICIL